MQAINNPLESYLFLARNATPGPESVNIIKQALEAPGIYVFGELLDDANISKLAVGEHAPYHQLLHIFAYGSCKDYAANRSTLPELTDAMLKKLRHLTIASLAMKSRYIPYQTLLGELDLRNVRELEDLVIEVIYNGVIQGKMDQKRQLLEVEHAIGRDAPPDALPDMIGLLQSWCATCETMLQTIGTEISLANGRCEANKKTEEDIQKEVINIKKTLRATQMQQPAQSFGQQPQAENGEAQSDQLKSGKKAPGKMKGLRGSATKSFKSSS